MNRKHYKRLWLAREDFPSLSDSYYTVFAGRKPRLVSKGRIWAGYRGCDELASLCTETFERATGISLPPGQYTEIELTMVLKDEH